MSGRAAEIAFACLLLLLPLSALIARRVPLGRTAKMAAAWLAIFVVGLLWPVSATGSLNLPACSAISMSRVAPRGSRWAKTVISMPMSWLTG